ncbi:hypothetical protein [Pantanalinema sp. GBBB05]|uniref:hypothetical protein n=1 Tax=Pantanalinema sp. GBBB05 TaxID=2604139 RepID=UPI001D97A30A|nr:hypothetical protein [Pantanalinema sp. GBBB05]
MTEQQDNEVAADFTRPWGNRRGIESIDRNATVVLVKAPLDALSDVLATTAIETRRNVLGSEIESSGYFELAYQIRGQAWSIMVPDDRIEPVNTGGAIVPSAAQLSQQLQQPVIKFDVSDTAGVLGYELFEGGEIVEYFAGSEDESTDWSDADGLPTQRYVLMPYPDDDPEAKQVAYFWSRRRKVTAKEIGNIWNFAERFMRESGAYDPAIDAAYLLGSYSLKRGGRYQVQNLGHTLVLRSNRKVTAVPDLIRVDYFRFGN